MLRCLTRRDLADLLLLSEAAGWNQIAADWERLLRLAPETCFGVEIEGRVVASATVLPYGERVAWLGMVLTHPSARRRGHARGLLQHILSLPFPPLALDATAEGEPLYASLGFEPVAPIYRYRREAEAALSPVHRVGGIVVELQDGSFGAERRVLLDALVREGRLYQRGEDYAIVRAGRLAAHLGPFWAASRQGAAALLAEVLASERGPLLADLHPHAGELFAGQGFVLTRKLLRMARGAVLRADLSQVYAAAGFELG